MTERVGIKTDEYLAGALLIYVSVADAVSAEEHGARHSPLTERG